MVAMLLVDMLDAIGCETVAVASQLEDALEKAQCLSFDLAILDVNLAGANTFKSQSSCRSVPSGLFLRPATATFIFPLIWPTRQCYKSHLANAM